MAAAGRSMKRAILTIALLLALPAGVAAQSAPDLEVAFPEVSDSSPVERGRFTLYVTVGNCGDAESAATTLRYYQSTDTTISSADTQVGTDAVGAVATPASCTTTQRPRVCLSDATQSGGEYTWTTATISSWGTAVGLKNVRGLNSLVPAAQRCN